MNNSRRNLINLKIKKPAKEIAHARETAGTRFLGSRNYSENQDALNRKRVPERECHAMSWLREVTARHRRRFPRYGLVNDLEDIELNENEKEE